MGMVNNKYAERILTVFLFLVILLPSFCISLWCADLEGFIVKKMGFLLISIVCVLIPLLFLKKKLYFILEGIFSVLISPIELSSLYLNHTTTDFMMMDTILNTNWTEAMELLSSIWVFALVVVIVFIAYFFITFKFIKNEDFFSKKLKKILLISIPVLLLIGSVYYFMLARKLMTSENTTFKDNLIDMKDMMTIKFRKIFPFDVYIATGDVIERRMEIKRSQEKLKDFSFGLPKKEDEEEEVSILVIGETARWWNFGVNGYVRNTTPELSRQKNLISYSYLVTQANLTSNSVPIILSRANALHSEIAYSEKSLCEAFAEVGFSTSWISDQELSTYQERVIETCDFSATTSDSKFVYDMDLLPSLDSCLKMKSPKKFIVIHTLGSHFKYGQRHPEEYKIYQPCYENDMDYLSINRDNKQLIINSYDNSIQYTDHFLGALIQRLEQRGGVWSLIFLSDHGENLFDDEHDLILHGSLVVSDYEARIPFFVVYSDEYASRYPEKVQNIEANKDKCLTSEVVFHSMLDMADVQSDVIDTTLSISRISLTNMDSTYILNGNRQPILFDFSRLKGPR